MKITVNKKSDSFKPLELRILLTTQQEVNTMFNLFNTTAVVMALKDGGIYNANRLWKSLRHSVDESDQSYCSSLKYDPCSGSE